ncbi:hypothetical protein ACNKHK_24100 [Shigella flexneri]
MLIVIMGGLVTAILHKLFAIPLPVVLGIFSGAVTNTRRWVPGSGSCAIWVPLDVVDQMGMSYAMAYPFGICGILLTMWLMRLIFALTSMLKPSSMNHANQRARTDSDDEHPCGKSKHQQYGNSGCPDSEQRQNHLLASET